MKYQASRAARIGVWIQLFIVASTLAVPALQIVNLIAGPDHLSIDCTRSEGRCSASSKYAWASASHFPIAVLGALRVENKRVMRDKERWTEKTDDVEALTRTVAALNAFPSGTAPTIHADLPQSRLVVPWGALVATLAFGVIILLAARRTILRSSVDVDRAADTVTLRQARAPFGTSTQSAALSSIQGVTVWRGRRVTRVSLDREEGEPLDIVRELGAPKLGDFPDQVASALGVPLRPT